MKTLFKCTAFLLAAIAAVCVFASCKVEISENNVPAAQIDKTVEIDLSAKGDDAYNACLDIQNNFKDYAGKTVRVTGIYQFQNYHFVIVYDQTQCCPAYFEFLYNGKYPKPGTKVTMTGKFDYYDENGTPYPYINVTKITEEK